MANKQDVNNAYYEGVCTILESLLQSTGICFSKLPVDMEELEEYAARLGYDEVADLAREQNDHC